MSIDEPSDKIILNIKPRLVRCIHCKIDTISDKPAPLCLVCNHQMFTVLDGRIE